MQNAFSSADLTDTAALPGVGTVPLNVARICEWTWMCAPAPVGPNIHANAAGYQVIADAFEQAIGPPPSPPARLTGEAGGLRPRSDGPGRAAAAADQEAGS